MDTANSHPSLKLPVAAVNWDFLFFNAGAKKGFRLATNGNAPALGGGQQKGFGLHVGSTAFWLVFLRAVRLAKASLLIVYFPQQLSPVPILLLSRTG